MLYRFQLVVLIQNYLDLDLHKLCMAKKNEARRVLMKIDHGEWQYWADILN